METINRIEQTYRRLISEGHEPIKLFSGNPNRHGFRFPSKILNPIYERYFKEQIYRPHPKGLKSCRKAIGEYYGRQGITVDSENITITSGTSESFLHLFSLLTQPGDNILSPVPAYPLLDHIAVVAKVELRHYPLREEKGWSLNLEAIVERTNHNTKGIVLVSPNNPTGAVLNKKEIHSLVEWCNQKKIPLICDEVFSDFYFENSPFPRPIGLASPDLCFTLNGISKMFALPGLKLGWIVTTGKKDLVENNIDHLETINDTFLSCHIPIQEALPDIFLKGEQFQKEYQLEVQKRRDLAVDIIKKSSDLSLVEPQGGFYLMLKVQKDLGLSEEELVIQLMEEKNIFVYPGYFFDYDFGLHLVISFLTKPEELKTGLEKIIEFIRET